MGVLLHVHVTGAGEITVDEALANIEEGWEEVTEEFDREKQLKLYRASLGLPNS